ncbi:MAG: transcriptional repressor LexA [Gammaproteobacteria bacterium]|nr:transcriptional repressor LexA [Gammaproteobacteria bacterium]
MKKLTRSQSQVFDFIRSFVEERRMPPTRAEICAALGFRSPNAAESHLRALERKGAIELLAGASRGIRLLLEEQGLPLVGRVAAGSPILAEENIEDHVKVDRSLFRPRADFLLRVKGASMRDAGIHDGDLLAVHKTVTAENEQIIVARLGDEVTVKCFRRRGNIVTLLPANPDFEPIRVDLRREELAVEGRMVGLIRRSLKGARPRAP